jgi:hypothetical protein
MKFLCTCGEVVRDQTDHLPYKASILADQSSESYFDESVTLLTSLAQAYARGELKDWVAKHLSPSYASQNLQLDSVIHDIIAGVFHRRSSIAYQCPSCGRLNLQDPADSDSALMFAPEMSPVRHDALSPINKRPHDRTTRTNRSEQDAPSDGDKHPV